MVHIGQNIARLRGMRRLTQKEMASKLNMHQPDYSRMENSELVEDDKLLQIADILAVPIETIKNFDELAPINIVSSTFHDNASINHNCALTFNPLEKIVEVYEENKKLYERLLTSERYRNEQLESLLKKKETEK